MNEATKPVGFGTKLVTRSPPLELGSAMGLLVPVMVGLVEALSVAVIVWLPAVFSVSFKSADTVGQRRVIAG